MNISTASLPVADGLLGWQLVPSSKKIASLADDVREGLYTPPRNLPPKYFYDETGSRLFDQICNEPEYYLTRTEEALIKAHAPEIIARVRPDRIMELGSGTARKTKLLLDACKQLSCFPSYAPFDVCPEVLLQAGRGLGRRYPWLEINALVGDYRAGLTNVPKTDGVDLVVFFGSTIGNFTHTDALAFLRDLRAGMAETDWFLLGGDRIKAPDVLHAAYNDKQGTTARFNLNVLNVLNKELHGSFDTACFRHYACYNPTEDQVEMYLVAMRDHEVELGGLDSTLAFAEGDAINTEISRKFTRRGLEKLLQAAGFAVEQHHEAERGYFSLVLARPS